MSKLVLLAACSVFAVACGGSTASCAVCDQAFSTSDCQAFAESQGCATGTAVADADCGAGTMGCSFTDCPVGEPITCEVVGDDSEVVGDDTGT